MKKLFSILAIVAVFATSFAVMAVEKPAPIKGTVTSVNADDKSFTISFKDDELTVKTGEKTKFLSDMKPSDFSIIVADVDVTIVGKVNKDEKTVNAIIVAVGKFELPKPDFIAAGTVKNLGDNTFSLENDKGTVTVNVSQKTKYLSKEGEKSFADIANDIEVTVTGNFDKDANVVNAMIVFWGKKDGGEGGGGGGGDQKPAPISGKASNINSDAKTFTLTNDKGELTVTVTVDTKFMPKDKTFAEIKDGGDVAVVGKIDVEAKTITATIVMIGKPEKPGIKPVIGTVSSINTDSKTFVLTADDGKTVNVTWSEKTKFFLQKEQKSADDLKDGATIAVVGKLDGDTLNAILISLDGKLPKKP